MRTVNIATIILLIAPSILSLAQAPPDTTAIKTKEQKKAERIQRRDDRKQANRDMQSLGGFRQFYPIGEDPYLCLKSSYAGTGESIKFEASPNVRFSFVNTFMNNLMRGENHASAIYILVKPHLRMYRGLSIPVKTPSTQVRLGTQQLWRLHGNDFLSFSFESGHYSNGQNGCTFNESFTDKTHKSDSIFHLITPQSDLAKMLNRNNGNFSTNLTELIVNYRLTWLLKRTCRTLCILLSWGACFTIINSSG